MDERNAKLDNLKGKESGERSEVKRERTKCQKGKKAKAKVRAPKVE